MITGCRARNGCGGWRKLLLLAWLGLHAWSLQAGNSLYAVLAGSTYTAGGRAPVVPLRGSFRFQQQVGPLVRQFYQVASVHLEVGSSTAPFTVWRGTGRYSIDSAGMKTQQLVLELTDGTAAVRFDSGLVPADGSFPDLNLTLAGDAPSKPMIHLVAVPELSRQKYRTVLETTLLDDCAICDRLSRPIPVEGSFDLLRTGGNPLFDRYHVLNLHFTDLSDPTAIEVIGEGVLEVGGEVAIQQRWTLQLEVRTPSNSRFGTMQNEVQSPGRLWPMLRSEVIEAGGTLTSRFFLNIAAAPFRELWFSTASGLTPGAAHPPAQRVSNADLLSDLGRVVVSGADVLKSVGISAAVGIDTLDVVPGSAGVLAFSLDQAANSTSLGSISEGDVLGSDGARRLRNVDLLGPLGFQPPTPDLGLDVFFQQAPGEFWFSVRRSAFSERLGVPIGRGDLLSSKGSLVRPAAKLLGLFHPPNAKHDYGLDACQVWPSGEIWFSLEEGFQDAALGNISDGDILSDQGYIVGRNLDLVRRFQPIEDVANFGLRGLKVITDVDSASVGAVLAVPKNLPLGVRLQWKGTGRIHQVEAAGRLDDPFVPWSPVLPNTEWLNPTNVSQGTQQFFRIRSWN